MDEGLEVGQEKGDGGKGKDSDQNRPPSGDDAPF